jgi:hypothetical protein
MIFYLVGPFSVTGMSWHEPFYALGFCILWIIVGSFYLVSSSKKKGKEIMLTQKPVPAS